MKKRTLKELLRTAQQYFDTIIEYYTTREFLEVTGYRGGEPHRYRFYYNGNITER